LNKCRNETTWIGDVVHNLQGGHFAPGPPFSKICNNATFYVNLGAARMYYVIYKLENLIRTTIHLGTHDHSVVEVHFREIFDQVKSLVEEEVPCTSWATVLAIVLVVSKTFLSKHLLNKDGKRPLEVFKGDKLHQVMDKFITLFSPNRLEFSCIL
jgi:hypothetical protein